MNINKQLDELSKRISMLGNVQMTMVDHFTANDADLMRKIMSSMLSNDGFRDDFTQYLHKEEAPDNIQLFMQEINEFMLTLNEEE